MLYMPKFTLGGDSLDLKDHLRALGMNEVFTDRADFSGMTGERNFFIDSVMHQAVIEVGSAFLSITSIFRWVDVDICPFGSWFESI